MDEKEWLECAEPDDLLFLPLLRNKISERKLRLFACACCRRLWNLLTDDRSRNLVEVAEKYADRLATQEDLKAAREMARHAVTSPVIIGRTTLGSVVRYTPGSVARFTAATPTRFSPRPTAIFAAMFAEELAGDRAAYDAEHKEQAVIFRELIGNPFRPISLDASWLTPTVKALAQSIYEVRNFTDLPVLADCLEEAGCTSEDILSHLRSPGEHVRGCWALDLVLGKE